MCRVEAPQAAALHGLGHRVVGPPGCTGLHLGHAELRLQEQMQAAVGQQQRVLQDPAGEAHGCIFTVLLYYLLTAAVT